MVGEAFRLSMEGLCPVKDLAPAAQASTHRNLEVKHDPSHTYTQTHTDPQGRAHTFSG